MTHLNVQQHTVPNINNIICHATYVGQGLKPAEVSGVKTIYRTSPTYNMVSLPTNIHSASTVINLLFATHFTTCNE